jgi:hypothetical protein
VGDGPSDSIRSRPGAVSEPSNRVLKSVKTGKKELFPCTFEELFEARVTNRHGTPRYPVFKTTILSTATVPYSPLIASIGLTRSARSVGKSEPANATNSVRPTATTKVIASLGSRPKSSVLMPRAEA